MYAESSAVTTISDTKANWIKIAKPPAFSSILNNVEKTSFLLVAISFQSCELFFIETSYQKQPISEKNYSPVQIIFVRIIFVGKDNFPTFKQKVNFTHMWVIFVRIIFVGKDNFPTLKLKVNFTHMCVIFVLFFLKYSR